MLVDVTLHGGWRLPRRLVQRIADGRVGHDHVVGAGRHDRPAEEPRERLRGRDPEGVACPSSTTCVAVGSYADTTPGVLPMVATEAGSTWGAATQLGLPAAAGGNQLSQLTSVSCVDAQTCVAVGSFSDKSSRAAIMVASEAAGAWHPAVQLALPADAGTVQRALGNVELSGVSCTDAQDCVAVGSYLNAAGAIVPMRATEAAGVWTRAVRSQLPAGTPSVSSAELYGVDCPQTGSCVAVGYVTTARRGDLAGGRGRDGWRVGPDRQARDPRRFAEGQGRVALGGDLHVGEHLHRGGPAGPR